MEANLNLAHRSHRKAEFYTGKHQFIEAIFHYTKASSYLEKAILCSRGEGIRSSLLVQRDHCSEQIRSLTRRLNNRLERDAAASSEQSKKHPQHQASLDSIIKDTIRINMDSKDVESKYRELYKVIHEHDTLLSHIIQADDHLLASGVTAVQAITTTGTPTTPTPLRSSPLEAELKSFKKKPKEDKEKIEELNVVNHKLRTWVDHLVEQLERSQKDVLRLQEENQALRNANKSLQERITLAGEECAKADKTTNTNTAVKLQDEPPKLLY